MEILVKRIFIIVYAGLLVFTCMLACSEDVFSPGPEVHRNFAISGVRNDYDDIPVYFESTDCFQLYQGINTEQSKKPVGKIRKWRTEKRNSAQYFISKDIIVSSEYLPECHTHYLKLHLSYLYLCKLRT